MPRKWRSSDYDDDGYDDYDGEDYYNEEEEYAEEKPASSSSVSGEILSFSVGYL